jgi:tight adherence protein B
VILWLAAVAAGAAVVVSRPRTARRRLTASQNVAARPAGSAPQRVLLIGTAIGSAIAAAHAPIPLALAGAAAPVVVTRIRAAKAASAERTLREAAVVELTFALASELRAGRTTREALSAVVDTAGSLRPVVSAAMASLAIGGSAADELEAGAALPGADRLRSVAAAWRVTESAGGRVALVLERLGESMDRDNAVRREMEAALAAPRATMALLASLPVVGLGLGQAIGAHPLELLLHRPLGWALLVAAGVLDGLGVVVTQRIASWALR